jgi:hypothetical protein
MTDIEMEIDKEIRRMSSVSPEVKSSGVLSSHVPPEGQSSGVLLWIMKNSGGLVKDEKTASAVSIVLAMLLLGIAIFVIPHATKSLPREDVHSKARPGDPAYRSPIKP